MMLPPATARYKHGQPMILQGYKIVQQTAAAVTGLRADT